MRQKFCVTLAVAVLTLSGARETYKQFNGLKSLAGEWSGAWNTMLVYAGAYADGAESRPAPALIASAADSRRAESAAPVVARHRRARAVRPAPRAHGDEAAELSIDLEELAFAFGPTPEAKRAATGEVSKPRLRVAANAGELASALAGAFHSDFDAESLRRLATFKHIEIKRALMSDEPSKHRRARAERAAAAARAASAGSLSRGRKRFVFKMAELPRVSAESLRAAEAAVDAAVEARPVVEASGGPVSVGEAGVFFVAPQTGSGLLNCDAQPRR